MCVFLSVCVCLCNFHFRAFKAFFLTNISTYTNILKSDSKWSANRRQREKNSHTRTTPYKHSHKRSNSIAMVAPAAAATTASVSAPTTPNNTVRTPLMFTETDMSLYLLYLSRGFSCFLGWITLFSSVCILSEMYVIYVLRWYAIGLVSLSVSVQLTLIVIEYEIIISVLYWISRSKPVKWQKKIAYFI